MPKSVEERIRLERVFRLPQFDDHQAPQERSIQRLRGKDIQVVEITDSRALIGRAYLLSQNLVLVQAWHGTRIKLQFREVRLRYLRKQLNVQCRLFAQVHLQIETAIVVPVVPVSHLDRIGTPALGRPPSTLIEAEAELNPMMRLIEDVTRQIKNRIPGIHRLTRREVQIHREAPRGTQVHLPDASTAFEGKARQLLAHVQKVQRVGKHHFPLRNATFHNPTAMRKEVNCLGSQHAALLDQISAVISRSGTLTRILHSASYVAFFPHLAVGPR